nr:hypothetical protein CFP56_55588 [Quercus suber]
MHLATEAKIGSPIKYCWIYPIMRYLSHLKSYVRNRAALEELIVEGYIVEECLTFCSRYMEGVEIIYNRPTRTMEESTGAVSSVTLDNREFTQTHRYVLFNSENIYQFHERGHKTDEFGFPMVNFTHSTYGGEEMVDEPYVLASQATQVFYVEDKRYKDWYVVVKTKVKDVFDTGIGPYCDKDDTYGFYENILYSVTSNDVGGENLHWDQDDVEGMMIDASIIGERDLHEMDNLDDCEFIDDESNDEDDNEVEYSDDE